VYCVCLAYELDMCFAGNQNVAGHEVAWDKSNANVDTVHGVCFGSFNCRTGDGSAGCLDGNGFPARFASGGS